MNDRAAPQTAASSAVVSCRALRRCGHRIDAHRVRQGEGGGLHVGVGWWRRAGRALQLGLEGL